MSFEGIVDGGRFVVDVPVRWSDMDGYGHVNHARTVTMLEEARVPWLFTPGSPTADLQAGCFMVDLHVRYHRQLRHDHGPLRISISVVEIRPIDFTAQYEIYAAGASFGDSPAVTATTLMVAFDVEADRPRRIRKDQRDYLSSFIPTTGGADE